MIEIGEYRGKPVITLKRDENDRFPFSFGLSKAKLILENLEEIKQFVNSAGRSSPKPPVRSGGVEDDNQ
ncbi:MAG: hypothetical protein AB1599_02075 [Planctomycetota bacterium]